MIHKAAPDFWVYYQALPVPVQSLADKACALLKSDTRHPSLHCKKVGHFWSARVGIQYRVFGVNVPDGMLWFWIASHADYDRLVG